MVPCLRAPRWPSDEFFKRRRTCDWPPAATRDEIEDFGMHLVPVGAKGSRTEREEWRLSFSRAEVVVAWHLTPTQLLSLILSKACKTALGPKGKEVKSYYLKTALFWLCQETPSHQWKSAMQGLMLMMDYLEKAINDRHLPCFFWTGINLLNKSTLDELDAMRQTVGLIQRHATRLVAHELSPMIEGLLSDRLLNHPADSLTEDQLRACFTGQLVADAVEMGIFSVLMSSSSCDDVLHRALLQSSAKEELASRLHRLGPHLNMQSYLLQALMAAPDDVKVRCRLTSRGDGMYSWDAGPLVALLTPSDLQRLVFDPAAVSAWLERQHRLPPERLPTGLPADLNSPRAWADLLLNPPLLARALRESVPVWWDIKLCLMRDGLFFKVRHPTQTLPPFVVIKRSVFKSDAEEQMFASGPQRRLHIDPDQTPLSKVLHLKDYTKRFFANPSTEVEYNKIRTSLPDSWRLRQYKFSSLK